MEWLREYREKAKLSQAELAKQLGKPQSFVAKIESCERRLDVLEYVRHVGALGLNPTDAIARLAESLEGPRRLRRKLIGPS